MIGKLTGVVDAVGADEVVLDVAGVGYLLSCGGRTLARLTAGETVALHVETHVREDQIRLFGFLSEEERAWFVRLQAVQGVGAKVALAVLDVLSPGELMTAANHEDAAAVKRAHGVGAKVAQRIVTELKDKPAPPTRFGGAALGVVPRVSTSGAPTPSPAKRGVEGDAISALLNLGLPDTDARAAVMRAVSELGAEAGLDDVIKAALKETAR